MNLKMLWDIVGLAADLYKSIDNHFKAKENGRRDQLKYDLHKLSCWPSYRPSLPEVSVDVQEKYASLAARSQIIINHITYFKNQPAIKYEFMPPENISINDAFSSNQVYLESIRKMRVYNFWNLPKAQQLAYLIYYRDEIIKITNYELERYIGRLAYETRDQWENR